MALHHHTPKQRAKIRRTLPSQASSTAKARALGKRGAVKRKRR